MSPRRAGVAVVALALSLGCGDRGRERPAPAPPSAGCRPGEQSTAVRGEERTIDVDGASRTYVLDVPMGPMDEARPVLLVFHALGARGRRLRRWSMLGRMGHRRGVIVVFPDGSEGVQIGGRTGRGWHAELAGSPDVAFVRALLDRLEGDWCVDPNRVWATGMANGGAFAEMLGCVLADRIDGIAPVAGARVFDGCAPTRPIPALIIHGRGDRVVPVESARAAKDWWVAENGCGEARVEEHCRHWEGCRGARVSYCEAGQGHTWPRPAGRRILDFFGTAPRRPMRPTTTTAPPAPAGGG